METDLNNGAIPESEATSLDALVTMDEAAVRLGVSEAAVARRLLSAAGLARRIGRRVLVVSRADLEAFAQKRGPNKGAGRPRKLSPKEEQQGSDPVDEDAFGDEKDAPGKDEA